MQRSLVLVLTILACSLHAGPNDMVQLQPFEKGVTIDGFLHEDVWKNASKITDFYTFMPVDGNTANERTALLLGYDQHNLYVAVICFDDPERVRATLARRDAIFDDDFVILYLDTFNDAEYAYQFGFNPYGVQADGIFTEHVGEDFKPDFIYESKGRLFSKGYIIEARIPFSSLNFPDKNVMNWRMGCFRRTQHKGHDIIWPRIVPRQPAFVGQFGSITGVKNIDKSKPVEILPEVTALRNDVRTTDELETGKIEEELGLNINFGLTSSLQAQLAFNPDFSQIESDANLVDVNRRYPLYYKEKRPFFLEDLELFQTPIQAVYTRQLADPLFAAKVSGRIGATSIGLISDVEQFYHSDNALGFFKPLDRDRTKPMFNTILRVKRGIGEKHQLGLLVTDREFRSSFNRLAGADVKLGLGEKWVLNMQGLYSNSRDGDGPIKDGLGGYLGLWKGGNGVNFQVFYTDLHPDFRADNGFLYRTDIRQPALAVWRDFNFDSGPLQQIRPYVYGARVFSHNGRVLDDYFYPDIFFKFVHNTSVTLQYKYSMTYWDERQHVMRRALFDIDNSTLSWLDAGARYFVGEDIYYYGYPAFVDYGDGTSAYIVLKNKNFNSTLSWNRYRFMGDRDEIDYRIFQNIYRLKLTWQLHRYIALRFIVENVRVKGENTYPSENQWDTNLLFSYTPSPGTVFYLGTNNLMFRDPDYSRGWLRDDLRLDNRSIFLKFSYLFRY